MSTIQHILIESDEAEQRLDRWFRRRFANVSQSQIEKLCRKGQIRVNGGRIKSNTRISPGQIVRIPPLKTSALDRKPDNVYISNSDRDMIRNCVLYKDDFILVLNKPAGLPVQGGSKQTRYIDGMTSALSFEREDRPRLVHRLDKDTSGLLVVAKNEKFRLYFIDLLQSRKVKKNYRALVIGTLRGNLEIDIPIGRDKNNRTKMTCREDGKEAITHVKLSLIHI